MQCCHLFNLNITWGGGVRDETDIKLGLNSSKVKIQNLSAKQGSESMGGNVVSE